MKTATNKLTCVLKWNGKDLVIYDEDTEKCRLAHRFRTWILNRCEIGSKIHLVLEEDSNKFTFYVEKEVKE